MSDSTDVLLDALCRAAFAPQKVQGYDPNNPGQQVFVDAPSPLVTTLAQMLQKVFSEDAHLRAVVLAELTKPETIQALTKELSSGIGRMRVNGSTYWGNAVEVPAWVNAAVTAALIEWLGSDDAAGLVPQMLERGTIKITVERKDANEKAR